MYKPNYTITNRRMTSNSRLVSILALQMQSGLFHQKISKIKAFGDEGG